jgi:hypothetical protein
MKEYSFNSESTTDGVADVFRLYGHEYRCSHGMTQKQHSVMSAIENCRTSTYGYHIDQCNACGHVEYEFNSCRDRHCPKCQAVSRKKWVESRLEDILPVAYYHVVFTLPHLLHPLISYNRALIYDLLFSRAAQTLLTFGRDPKWLGGEIGFYGVLHTWGQKLWKHPHIHFIVPGGALTGDGCWVEPRYPNKFLFPIRALSQVFRGKFVGGVKNAYYGGDMRIPEDLGIVNADQFEKWIDKLVSRNWVVYCKPPFSDAEQVVRYIGRYTHRVAISNTRIIEVANGKVQFWYKDYRAGCKAWKTMWLTAPEFIRRFLDHVLPVGFHKIRHYGFLANGRCKAYVAHIRAMLSADTIDDVSSKESVGGIPCPECGDGILFTRIIKTRFATIIKTILDPLNGPCAFDTS